MAKKVIFVHYKTHTLDGVSLEIEHRARIFKNWGWKVFYLTGEDPLEKQAKNIYIIPELKIKNKTNLILNQILFEKTDADENIALTFFELRKKLIFSKISRVFKKIQPNLVYIHNLFSYACNLPATKALMDLLDQIQTPTLIHAPDFWFTREAFAKPQFAFVKNILSQMPPKRDYILGLQVINSLEKKQVERKRRLKADLFADVFDFDQKNPASKKAVQQIREKYKIKNHPLILHATRITRRKNIENSLLFSAELQKKIGKKIFLLFPNFVESGDEEYAAKLQQMAKTLNINAIWAQKDFALQRNPAKGIFSFWDAYDVADIITYTSQWEGFGNQLLEAVFFRKILVLFEYPVFKTDIKKQGYKYISLGDKIIKRSWRREVPKACLASAAEKTAYFLQKKEKWKKIAEKNFCIAKRHHHIKNLELYLKEKLKSIS